MDIPNCKICRSPFDLYDALPIILPVCGHTFCKNCLGKQLKKKEFDTYFYQYYFSEACKAHDLTIDAVQNPANSKGVKTKLKTVNTEYICNITKSEKFMKDFTDYMHGSLQLDYDLTIDAKIDALVRRWDEAYGGAAEKPAALQQITDYVLKNKKCKLPWTMAEVRAALDNTTELIRDSIAKL